jgi:hypothetical protein
MTLRGLSRRELHDKGFEETRLAEPTSEVAAIPNPDEPSNSTRSQETDKASAVLDGLETRFREALLGRLRASGRSGDDASSRETAESLASAAVEIADALGRQKAGEFMSRALSAAELAEDAAAMGRTLDDFFAASESAADLGSLGGTRERTLRGLSGRQERRATSPENSAADEAVRKAAQETNFKTYLARAAAIPFKSSGLLLNAIA